MPTALIRLGLVYSKWLLYGLIPYWLTSPMIVETQLIVEQYKVNIICTYGKGALNLHFQRRSCIVTTSTSCRLYKLLNPLLEATHSDTEKLLQKHGTCV